MDKNNMKNNNMSIRLATDSDLEAMTRVLIGASPLDPVYPYRFPDRHLYPSEFSALCRQKCAEYLATSTVVVCEMPMMTSEGSHNLSNPPRAAVVAFAAWDTPDSRLRTQSGGTGTSFHNNFASFINLIGFRNPLQPIFGCTPCS